MTLSSRTAISLLAAALLLGGLRVAQAEQVEQVRPDGTAVARISTRETTRIKVDHARIVDVFGDVDTAANPAGALKVIPDPDSGEIYVRPVPAAALDKPINIFVKTTGGTYTLLLKPADVPSDTIVLHDPSVPAGGPDGKDHAAAEWVREIKNIELAMDARTVPDGFGTRYIGRPVKLWREARFMELRQVSDRYMVGTVYDLTNVSKQMMVIDPREFDTAGVVAVSVDRTDLQPGQTARVHVTRSREDGRG